MFGRWSQENWFKYARREYALDVLVDYTVEPDDPQRLVVNPVWRELDKQVQSAYGRLQRAQAKYARLALKAESAAGRRPTTSSRARQRRGGRPMFRKRVRPTVGARLASNDLKRWSSSSVSCNGNRSVASVVRRSEKLL